MLRNLLIFGRLLRALGLKVSSAQIREVADALAYVDVTRRQDFRNAARAILVSRREDIALFNRAFDLFWQQTHPSREPWPRLIEDLKRQILQDRQAPLREGVAREQRRLGADTRATANGSAEEAADEQTILALYSPGELVREKDFASLTPDELADAKRFLAEMRWSLALRRTRRLRPGRRGPRLDVRRSLRRSLPRGGEMLDLARRGPKPKRRPLVLLCDISGSMDRYTRLLLHFLHSIERTLQHAEIFVFGTRLTRITRALHRRDPDAAIAAVASEVHDWSGGTRIGECLHTFNRHWARRVLGRGAIVMVISDGWDRGDPELLAEEMARLQRHSYRLLWLNPLLGSAGYEPLTQGIQAALPHVDDFLPIHNLASLTDLAKLLNEMQEGRPVRRRT